MLTQVPCERPKIYTFCNKKALPTNFFVDKATVNAIFQKNLSTKYFEYTIQFSSVGKFIISPA
jgi:hypothetical protein